MKQATVVSREKGLALLPNFPSIACHIITVSFGN